MTNEIVWSDSEMEQATIELCAVLLADQINKKVSLMDRDDNLLATVHPGGAVYKSLHWQKFPELTVLSLYIESN